MTWRLFLKWQINEVVKFDNELYRILCLKDCVVWIQLNTNKGMPKTLLEIQLSDFMNQGRLVRHEDPYEYLKYEEPLADSIYVEKRDKAFSIIEPIVADENCFDTECRARLINKVAKFRNIQTTIIYRILRKYWQRGQIVNALLPEYKNCGGKGKSRSGSGTGKAGPKRRNTTIQGTRVTPEVERMFQAVIKRDVLKPEPFTLVKAHENTMSLYKQHYPKAQKDDGPTHRQFSYYFKTNYRQPSIIEAQTDTGVYLKDVRPLKSTATSSVLGPGSRYEIDATIVDIYLVDENDREKIIGRPTLYVVVDVFSRLIAGFYIGFENPSYVVAMQAFYNACVDKVAICKEFEIDISEDDWPAIGLPDAILADRGELMSNQVTSLIESYNVRIENAPPRRGDAKGVVERSFQTIQAEFKPYAAGVVQGSRIKKHGEEDYRLKANLTIRELTKIILHSIIYRNKYHELKKYDRDVGLPTDIPSVPLELWRWGIQNRTGSLRAAEPDALKVALMPRESVSVSSLGISMFGMYYSGSEVLRQGWLHRSSKVDRPQNLKAAYDPASADTIYLFPVSGARTYWICTLTDSSRRFRGFTFWQVWETIQEEKKTANDFQEKAFEERLKLNKVIQDTLQAAEKQTPKPTASNAERVKKIRDNKKEAIKEQRQERAKRNTIDGDRPIAPVIPLRPDESNSSYPDFSAELFEEEDDENI